MSDQPKRRSVHAKGRGRRPADVLAAARRPHGRPAVWRALRKLSWATMGEIAREADADIRTARSFVEALHAAGLVLRHDDIKAVQWLLKADAPAEMPRLRPDGSRVTQGDGRERLWRTMKMLKTFTAQDLAVAASLPDAPVQPGEAKDYARTLAAAGYLATVKPGTPQRGQAVYRLVRNTGPLPPQIQRCSAVFDPNLRQVVWHSAGAATHG